MLWVYLGTNTLCFNVILIFRTNKVVIQHSLSNTKSSVFTEQIRINLLYIVFHYTLDCGIVIKPAQSGGTFFFLLRCARGWRESERFQLKPKTIEQRSQYKGTRLQFSLPNSKIVSKYNSFFGLFATNNSQTIAHIWVWNLACVYLGGWQPKSPYFCLVGRKGYWLFLLTTDSFVVRRFITLVDTRIFNISNAGVHPFNRLLKSQTCLVPKATPCPRACRWRKLAFGLSLSGTKALPWHQFPSKPWPYGGASRDRWGDFM